MQNNLHIQNLTWCLKWPGDRSIFIIFPTVLIKSRSAGQRWGMLQVIEPQGAKMQIRDRFLTLPIGLFSTPPHLNCGKFTHTTYSVYKFMCTLFTLHFSFLCVCVYQSPRIIFLSSLIYSIIHWIKINNLFLTRSQEAHFNFFCVWLPWKLSPSISQWND